MAYQTLYRKWRPKTFDEVVGQNHITSTLKNEIVNDRISHAYVFTGTRGTGKTSTAKILSRAINCENPVDGNPCNACPSCMGIINESILDVVEMDAASNTGVDNIREIIDQVRYSTASSKFKVYIIDEVHMLSQGAFNALLKTLEEPPSHVVFILATTEIHKVPATILSRCQRFDFKNITTAHIEGALYDILNAENVKMDKDAIEYIAYLGNGSMRDALSITEQCLAYKADNISYSDVCEILGTLDESSLYEAAHHIAKGNVKELLCLFNDCIKQGKNPDSFAEGMLKTMRDILLYKLSPEICDFTEKKKSLINDLSALYTKDKLMRCLEILSDTIRDIKYSQDTGVLIECSLIKMASPQYDADLSSLLDRISALENKLNNASFGATSSQKTAIKPKEKDPSYAEDEPLKAPKASNEPEIKTKPAQSLSVEGVDVVISGWDQVKKALESKGKLLSFVSLYGVTPKCNKDTLVLCFNSKDSASKFATGTQKADVAEVIEELFGLKPEIKCIFQEKNDEAYDAGDDIFDNIAKISSDYPENFKID